jgi:hypothetical protein
MSSNSEFLSSVWSNLLLKLIFYFIHWIFQLQDLFHFMMSLLNFAHRSWIISSMYLIALLYSRMSFWVSLNSLFMQFFNCCWLRVSYYRISFVSVIFSIFSIFLCPCINMCTSVETVIFSNFIECLFKHKACVLLNNSGIFEVSIVSFS